MKLNRYLESTLLKPTVTEREIELLIADALAEQFIGICVPPFWVKKVKREVRESDIQVVTVIGFPFGYETTAAKVAEAHAALEAGADELDVVWCQTGRNQSKRGNKNVRASIGLNSSRSRSLGYQLGQIPNGCLEK